MLVNNQTEPKDEQYQAIERGLLPPQNSRVTAYCVAGMIERIASHWLAGDVTDDLVALADAVARFELLNILSVPLPEMKSFPFG